MRVIVIGSHPVRTTVDVGKREGVDLNMLSLKGRGGFDGLLTGNVVQQSEKPVFIVPIQTTK